LGARGFRFGGRQGAGFHHRLQDGLLPLLGSAEIACWRKLRWRPYQARKHRRLGERQFAGLLPEIPPGGSIDTVSAGAKIGGVEISQKDVFFLQLALQPKREERFLDLSAECALLRQKHQAGKLLRDGAAALPRTADL